MIKYGLAAVYGTRLAPVCKCIDKQGKFHGYRMSMDSRQWLNIVKFGHKETAEKTIVKIQENIKRGLNRQLKDLDLKVVELKGADLEAAIKSLYGDSK